ncbi:MAG: YfhO family protein, partial [Deltaproteobacteria bacterium]|nr:YfhO family protein [Deltaproteobacteria bacterium]
VGGVYGVSFLCWAVVFGIYLLLHRSMTLRGANPFLAVFAIFAFSGFLRIRIQPRPEIFTYLFIALTIFLLSEYYFGEKKWLLYLFPPLILVWANMHPSYLIAFVLCGVFFVDGLARAAWKKESQWIRLKTWVIPPVLVGGLGLIVCGLNPHGYSAILTPLHLISRGESGAGEGSSILMSISELTPVKGTGMYLYYKAAALFAAFSLLLGIIGRRVYLLDLFLFTIAFKGAWDSARAVSMMGLFLSPGASLHLTGFFGKLGEWFVPKGAQRRKEPPEKKRKKKEKRQQAERSKPVEPPRVGISWGKFTVSAGMIGALIVFGSVTLSFSFSQLQYGVGMTEHKFSFPAAEFLKKNPIPGKMFNFFDIGGFLDWQLYPQALTFIDGRTYNEEVFREHQMVTGALPGWEDILRKYGITYIVLKSMDSSGVILPVIPALSRNPDWSLVFADGLFVIFVRNSPQNEAYIAKHRISKEVLPRQIITESYHYMYLGVSPVMAYANITNMYLTLGNRKAAIDVLRKSLEDHDEPYLRNMLMQLERGGEGNPPSGGLRK